MGLFGPIWLKSSLEGERMKKALDALRKITDQQKLKEAVLKARYREIKETALDRITDEKVLQEIFKVGTLSLNDSWIRFQIIRRSEDQGFLYAFASDLGNGSLGIGGVQEREAAINRLNDPDQVYAIMRRAQELSRKVVPVFQSGMRDIGAVASQRLVGIIDQTTDKKVLLKYLDSRDEYARKAASRRARELSIPLPEVPKAEASEPAVDKKDKPVGIPKEKALEAPVPEELPDIIMTSDSYRRADAERAVWALTSQKQIAQAARKAPLPRVRLAAVSRLEDQAKLKSVALHDKDYEVREMAAKS